MAERRSDYYNNIGRSDGIGYNPNAVNVLWLADELTAFKYNESDFGTKENYYLWLKAQAENNILVLLQTLYNLGEQAGNTNTQIGAYVLAGSSVLAKTGVSTLAASILAGAGTLLTFLERKQKNSELELIKKQVEQVKNELVKQKQIYDNAVAELASIRNQRIVFGLIIAFGLYLLTKKRK